MTESPASMGSQSSMRSGSRAGSRRLSPSSSRISGRSASNISQRLRSRLHKTSSELDPGRVAFRKEWKQKFEDEKPPTQKLVEEGETLCVCPMFHDCEKVATIHPEADCDYCHGAVSKVFPQGNIHRYYPCDDGWEDFRAMVVQLRRYAPDVPNSYDVESQMPESTE